MQYENYDLCFPDQPVVDLYLPVWAKLPAFSTKPAFVWAENGSTKACSNQSSLTYKQLNNSVQSISLQLLLTLQRRDTVVVLCSPGLELVEMILGCQRAGLVAVLVVPPDPSFCKNDHHHLVRALSQTKPEAVIAHSSFINRIERYIFSSRSCNVQLRELLRKLTWISMENLREKKQLGMESDLVSYNGVKSEEVYLIQYTSGATGVPKPVMVTAGSAAHNVRAARKAYDLHPNSVVVSWLPQYHDCGFMFLLLTIVSGATCVLTSPQAFMNRPRLWLELITEYKATCTPVPSFSLPLVVKKGEFGKGSSLINLSTMKNLILVNEPIYNKSVEDFVEVSKRYGLNPGAISPSYGLAENCTFVSTAWRRGSSSSLPVYKKLLPSARLAWNGKDEEEEEEIDILIVDEETHELVEDGVEGEIWISSPSNASGYVGHPSLTRQVFNARLKSRLTSCCFLRTGDRGIIIGEERFLFVTGRCADIVKLQNNQEVDSHSLESAAYDAFPRFLRGGCVAAFMVSETIVVVAELQKGEGEAKILQKLCEDVRRCILKEENVEVGMVILVKGGDVPKTSSGKIMKRAAKHKLMSGEMNVVMHMKSSTDILFSIPYHLSLVSSL